MRTSKILFVLFILISLLLFSHCKKETNPVDFIESYGNKTSWIKSNAITVKSVIPSDEDYSDLEPLKKIIGNSRIVLLGEQSHGDGTTFLAKTRLIKYLHKEMGYDVILFESGLYGCKKIDDYLNMGIPPLEAFRKGLFKVWSYSEQFQYLVDFIGTNKNSLAIGGFDLQFTGDASKDHFVNELEDYLRSKNISELNSTTWATVKTILQNLSENKYNYASPPTTDIQSKFFELLSQLRNALIDLNTAANQMDMQFWIQMLESTKTQAKMIWDLYPYPKNSFLQPAELARMRDEQMARNLIWQAKVYHPNQKIIVWAATYHIMRNVETIEFDGKPECFKDLPSMGQIASAEFGMQMYSLGFTAYEGTWGDVESNITHSISKPIVGSLEDIFNNAKLENAILDFRNISSGGDWLSEKIISRPLSYTDMKANCTQVLDGIMYTRLMVPSKRTSY